jgi:hypothetical protein
VGDTRRATTRRARGDAGALDREGDRRSKRGIRARRGGGEGE